MVSIGDLVGEYIAFERRLHPAIAVLSAGVCRQCPAPCCRPDFCGGVRESVWLRSIHQALGRTVPGAGGAAVDYLTGHGCVLPAGRPLECTGYICDRIILALREPLERFAYQVYSYLPGYVVRRAARGQDLTDIEDLASLTPQQRGTLRKRIRTAQRCLDIMENLLRRRAQQAPVGEIIADVLWVARTLPFAAQGVRFTGEEPALSRAARKAREALTPGAYDHETT